MQKNDGAVEIRIGFADNSVDQKLGSLRRIDTIQTVDRPINRAIAERVRDFQNPVIARAKGRTPQWAGIAPANTGEDIFTLENFCPDNFVGVFRQIEMMPGVISHFVPMPNDFSGALRISLGPISGDEERAADMRMLEISEQFLETLGLAAGIKCQCDLMPAAQATFNLQRHCSRAHRQRDQVKQNAQNATNGRLQPFVCLHE